MINRRELLAGFAAASSRVRLLLAKQTSGIEQSPGTKRERMGPRLRQVPLAEATPEVADKIYKRVFGEGRDPVAKPGTATGTPGNWYTVWANSPRLFIPLWDLMLLELSPDMFPPKLREIALVRTGFAAGSKFVYSQHRKSARTAGLPDDKMDEVSSWGSSDKFDPAERSVLAYVDELVLASGRVQDATMERLKKHLPDEQILNLTFTVCMYVLHATMCKALRLEYDDADERIVEVPAPSNR